MNSYTHNKTEKIENEVSEEQKLSRKKKVVTEETLYTDRAGRSLRQKDLKPPQEESDHEAETSVEARTLWDKGRRLGSEGELYKAAEAFLQATLLAPFWPRLYFDLGTTYLHLQNVKKALVCYKKADKVAPRGFLSTKAAVFTLQREENCIFAQGTYLLYHALSNEDDPDRQKQLAHKILSSSPHFAPAWMELVHLSDSKREQMYYINKGLNCEMDCETRGFLSIQKSLVLFTSGRKNEALDILSDVIHAPDCTLRNEKQAKMLLSAWLI